MKYSRKSPLISIHIPKCAGSSFLEILEEWFGDRLLRHYHDEALNISPKKHPITKGRFFKRNIQNLCIHGHFNHARNNGVTDYYPNAKQLITIIRDPWELHLSTYFYVLRESKTSGHSFLRKGKLHPIIENNWSIEEYLLNNPKSYLLNFFPKYISLSNYQEVLEESFLFIGITEKLQTSIDMLAQLLDKKTMKVPRVNIAERIQPPSQAEANLFYSNNELEKCIYDYCLEKFN